MIPDTYNVRFNPSDSRFALDRQVLGQDGRLYAYKWKVTKLSGEEFFLCGISQTIATRLSQYISEFNEELTKGSCEFDRLVNDRNNRVSVDVFGPYPKTQDAKKLEEDFIRQVPAEQRLNKTKGGNGGGSWAQYADLPPSQNPVPEYETPTKYYSFRRVDDESHRGRSQHITIDLTPSAKTKKQGGVYRIKRIDGKPGDYVGLTTRVPTGRWRVHASHASSASPQSKIAKAIAKSPAKFAVGLVPIQGSPRTLRAMERKFIGELQPTFNTNRGGGGPAPLWRGSHQTDDSVVKKLAFS